MSIGPTHTRSGSACSVSQGRPACPVLGLLFNQDASCFSVGLENGFRIYSTEPLREVLRRDYEDGGIAQISMLQRTNILALVGGGRTPRFAANKVVLFDEKTSKAIAELEFRSEVRRVLLRRDRLVIALSNRIHVFTLDRTPKKLQTFETFENDGGICAVSQQPDGCVLAFPSAQTGHVCVTSIGGEGTAASILPAHESPIAFLAIDVSGSRIATASEKGTLVRVFQVKTGRLICELRRGADKAEIFNISFSRDSSRLCVSSDKGTVHIFNIEVPGAAAAGSNFAAEFGPAHEDPSANKHSSLFFMKDLLPKYFSSQWSFAQCRVSDNRCVATFGQDPSTILVVSVDGSFYRYRFDAIRGGECVREYYAKFLSLGSDFE